MDEPPRKRRKTSSPAQAPSSPLRKPPRRPSFASPTKASLARNYPSLLPNRTRPHDPLQSRAKPVRAVVFDGSDTAPKDTEDESEEEVELRAAASQRGPEAHQDSRRGIQASSLSKPMPRASGVVVGSPLKNAPAVQQKQLSRSVEEALDPGGQDKEAQKPHLNPEIEEKKLEKARLRREIKALEAQVSRCTKEIVAEQRRVTDDVLLPAQRADLIKFVAQISGADARDERSTQVSSLLCSFLPFSGLNVPPPKQPEPQNPIASHHPTEVKDPLPYLKMFTSFHLSTDLGLPQDKLSSSSKGVLQKHTISISGPQKLLTAQVAVNVDALTSEVIDMHLLRLPSWAEQELGAFVRARAKEKDLGNACWAIDSYWDITTKRAQYWHKCEKAFTRLLPGRTAADAENTAIKATKSSTLARKDLSRHLGRDVLILQDKHVLLKINWHIVFDWTGEAESNVDLECAVPAAWKESDASDTFRKIPETFDSLLRTKGVFEATKIMVTLLFSQ